MTKTQKITAYFFTLFIGISTPTLAADYDSIDCKALYTAGATYRQLIEEAAKNTLQTPALQEFMATVNEYPTKQSGDQKVFDTQGYQNFKKKSLEVQKHKFTHHQKTPLGEKSVYSASYLAAYDLGYALNGIIEIATCKANQSYSQEQRDLHRIPSLKAKL